MSGRFYLRIEMDGKSVTRLKHALEVLGESEAPFLREALDDVGQKFAGEIRQRAPGSMASKVDYVGVRGEGVALRASGWDRHPGAKSMEFGRKLYWHGGHGNNRPGSMRRKGSLKKGASKGPSRSGPGQAARPFIGIIGNTQAIAAVQPYARARLRVAINREWTRLAAGGGAPE